MRKILIFTVLNLLAASGNLLTAQMGSAQSSEQDSNSFSDNAASFLATNAKYHVVIGVLVVIFIGLVVYGLILNKKISNLEAKQK